MAWARVSRVYPQCSKQTSYLLNPISFQAASYSHILIMSQQQSIRWPNPTLPDSVFQMFNMQGKVVIITGGTGGIGYSVARGLAEAGANIALWYYKSDQADALASALEKDFGVKAKAYKCSVQNFDEVP